MLNKKNILNIFYFMIMLILLLVSSILADSIEVKMSESGAPIKTKLLNWIGSAQDRIYVATFSFYDKDIFNALIAAKNRGVGIVKIVANSDDDMDALFIDDESDPSKKMIFTRNGSPPGLQHNKFFVIDGNKVALGSANITISNYNGRVRNNFIFFESSSLAQNYENEMSELIGDNPTYGGGSATVNTEFTIDGTKVENYFSPDDGVRSKIIDIIKNASVSIQFAVYTFTSSEIYNEIISRYNSGVLVQGVLEKDMSSFGNSVTYNALTNAGIQVKWDEDAIAVNHLIHHKFIIVDNKIVITGSYNMTDAAENKNDENIVIIHNEEIAQKFYTEFVYLYGINDQIAPSSVKNVNAKSYGNYIRVGWDKNTEDDIARYKVYICTEIISTGFNTDKLVLVKNVSSSQTTTDLKYIYEDEDSSVNNIPFKLNTDYYVTVQAIDYSGNLGSFDFSDQIIDYINDSKFGPVSVDSLWDTTNTNNDDQIVTVKPINFPNPFIYPSPYSGLSNSKLITFQTTPAGYEKITELWVYDIYGNKIFSENYQPSNKITWNGKNTENAYLKTGIYLYFIKTDNNKMYKNKITYIRY